MKPNAIIAAVVVTAIAAAIIFYFFENARHIIGIGAIAAAVLCVLWGMPPKHKNFSYSDQQQATFRAMGGGGQPGLDALLANTKPEKKKKNRKRGK